MKNKPRTPFVLSAGALACATLLASACSSEQDRGFIDEPESSDLEVGLPLRLEEGESMALRLAAELDVEIEVTRDATMIVVDPATGAETEVPVAAEVSLTAFEGDAELFTTAIAGDHFEQLDFDSPSSFVLEITNEGPGLFLGTLAVAELELPPPCDESAYQTWLGTFQSEVDAAGATIDADDQSNLQALLDVRPCAASSQSYLSWLDFFSAEFTGAGSVIDDNDSRLLDLVAAARPQLVESDEAYLNWMDFYAAQVDDAGATIDDADQSKLDRIAVTAPLPSSDEGYFEWLDHFESAYDDAGNVIDDNDARQLALWTDNQPLGGTAAAYGAWIDGAVQRVSTLGSTIDDGDQVRVDAFATAMPCVSGLDELAAAELAFQDALASLTGEQLQAVVPLGPVSCE